MRRWRVRAWLVLPPLLLVFLLVSAAWLAGSEAALRFLARQAVALSGGQLAIEGVNGSLYGPLRIDALRLDGEEKRFELRDLRLDWSPRALWQRDLRISQLELAELRVSAIKPSAEPPKLPETLRLPLALSLPSVRIDRLLIQAAGREWRLGEIEFGLDKPVDTYRLDLRTLATPWGRARAHASLAESPPFKLDGEARFQHASGELKASAGGRLDRIRVSATAALAGGRGQADLLLTPFARRPLESARISAARIDPAAWDKTLPRADLELHAELRAGRDQRFAGDLAVRNALPGSWDQRRLPLREATARIDGNLDGADLSALRLDLGRAGIFTGTGHVDASGARLDLRTERFDPRGLHGKLRSLRLAGDIRIQADPERQSLLADLAYQRYRLRLDAEYRERVLQIREALLSAAGSSLSLHGSLGTAAGYPFDLAGALRGFDPAAFGAYPSARVNASFSASGRLAPATEARVNFAIADSHFRSLPLSGQGHLRLAARRLWDSDAALRLGANRLALRGAFGAPGDRLSLRLRAEQLGVIHGALSGRVEASATLAGTLALPAGDLDLAADNLGWGAEHRLGHLRASARMAEGLAGDLTLNAELAGLRAPQLNLARATLAVQGRRDRHDIRLTASHPELDLNAHLAGAWRDSGGKAAWSGQIESLAGRGRHSLALLAPARLRFGADHLLLEAARIAALDARFDISQFEYQAGNLRSQGEFSGLSATALGRLAAWPEAARGDLVLGGQWRIDAGARLNGHVSLTRERGDLQFADTALGLTRLNLAAEAEDSRLRARLEADGATLGRLRATGESRLTRRDGAWGLAGDAPIQADADLALQSLAWAAPLLDQRGATQFDGRLTARVQAAGTLAAPRFSGTLAGERLTLALPEHGLNLREGRFQAELRQDTLELKTLSLRGGDGLLTGQGRMSLRADQPDMRLALRANQLRVISRPDRLLILSGDGQAALAADGLRLAARLKADRGLIELARDDAPTLSEDVVVLGRKKKTPAPGKPLAVALELDLNLGERFFLKGRGLDAQLGGSLKLSGQPGAPLRANGGIKVLKGAYAAYGQRLEIERGILNFQGPLDNPGLNIAAWRRNQEVAAGVAISGSAQAPQVSLISDPVVPDSEKLSWLVLGHGLSDAGGQEFDVMQLAAGALLGAGESITLQQRIARAAGLEEVSLKGAGTLESTVLTLGKRLSSRAYLSYEQGLAGTTNLLKINYTLTRRLSLRAQAGATPALDLFYTFSFD